MTTTPAPAGTAPDPRARPVLTVEDLTVVYEVD